MDEENDISKSLTDQDLQSQGIMKPMSFYARRKPDTTEIEIATLPPVARNDGAPAFLPESVRRGQLDLYP
jgi:hypothetical protein